MNTKKTFNFKGIGIYIVLVLAVVCIWYWLGENAASNSYTTANFEKALEEKLVDSVEIVQNREIPTGSLVIHFADGKRQTLYVSDVNEIAAYLRESGVKNYTQADIPAESWVMTILPYLLIFGAMFIFFMMLTGQNAANSGSNSKMMNFGTAKVTSIIMTPFMKVNGKTE